MFKIDFEVEKLRNYQKYETSINNPSFLLDLIRFFALEFFKFSVKNNFSA